MSSSSGRTSSVASSVLIGLMRTRRLGHYLLGAEGRDGLGFVVLHVENRIQLSDLQQIMHLAREVQKLQIPARFADLGEAADQFAQARTVNVGDLAKVQEDAALILCQEPADGVAQGGAAIAQ